MEDDSNKQATSDELVACLDRYHGMLPRGFRFNRDEANERHPHAGATAARHIK